MHALLLASIFTSMFAVNLSGFYELMPLITGIGMIALIIAFALFMIGELLRAMGVGQGLFQLIKDVF